MFVLTFISFCFRFKQFVLTTVDMKLSCKVPAERVDVTLTPIVFLKGPKTQQGTK